MQKLEKTLKIAIIAMLSIIVLYTAKTVFLSNDEGNVSIITKPANESPNDSNYGNSLLSLEEKTAVPDAERIDEIRNSISKLIGHDNKMDLVLINSYQGEMRFKFCPEENSLELEGMTIDKYSYYIVKNKFGEKINKNDIQKGTCYNAKYKNNGSNEHLPMSSCSFSGSLGEIMNMLSEFKSLNFAITDDDSRRMVRNVNCKINFDNLNNKQIIVFMEYVLGENNFKIKHLEDNIYKVYSDQSESPNNNPFPIPKSKDFRFPSDPPPPQQGRFTKKK